jgi:hypothetical protein
VATHIFGADTQLAMQLLQLHEMQSRRGLRLDHLGLVSGRITTIYLWGPRETLKTYSI